MIFKYTKILLRLRSIGLLLSFFIWASKVVYGQQEPMFTQNNFDRLVFNPAYAGSSGWVVTSLKHRSQFIGLEGGPSTQVLTVHAPWQEKSMGFGMKVINDHAGVTGQLALSGIYSYHLGLGKGKLSIGIEGGFFSQTIDFSSLIRKDLVDPAIPNGKTSSTKPDGAFGIQYQEKNYFAGFSIVHLFSGELNFAGTERSIVAELSRHYFVSGGYVHDLSADFSLQPCILIKKVSGAPMQGDLYLNAIYKEKYTLGLGYRTGDAMTFVLKYNITDALRIAYSYDYRVSEISSITSGAHELMVRYGIKLLPPQQVKEINPRYYF